MATDAITKAFASAAEIVKKLPKHLHEVAFNRALDHLLGRERDTSGAAASAGSRSRKPPASGGDASASILDKIDRTKYPDVGSTTRVADRALKVLQLAHDDYGVDGLTATGISEILTKRFRLTVTANAVNMALERETNTVDVRQSRDGTKTFHLMAPGEDYLRELRSGQRQTNERGRKSRVSKRTTRKSSRRRAEPSPSGTATPPSGAASSKRKPRAAAKKRTSRPGPKAAVDQLVSAGFFKSPRAIGDVQVELKHKRGHSYSLQELAPAMVRSLRDDTLTRERNKSGQYEYTEA